MSLLTPETKNIWIQVCISKNPEFFFVNFIIPLLILCAFIRHYVSVLAGATFEEALKKLDVLDQADRERVARETALNELQGFVFDLQDKIYQVSGVFGVFGSF